jgi:dihydrofolate synthase/folylpolyglutamate synthase
LPAAPPRHSSASSIPAEPRPSRPLSRSPAGWSGSASIPPVYLDAAHNPDGAAALAEALPEVVGERPVVAVLAVLADKDAQAMIQALAPTLSRVVCTEIPSPPAADGPQSAQMGRFEARRRRLGAGELTRVCEEAGVPVEAKADFAAAVARGRELALEAGGVLLVAGSHYALAPAREALDLCED